MEIGKSVTITCDEARELLANYFANVLIKDKKAFETMIRDSSIRHFIPQLDEMQACYLAPLCTTHIACDIAFKENADYVFLEENEGKRNVHLIYFKG